MVISSVHCFKNIYIRLYRSPKAGDIDFISPSLTYVSGPAQPQGAPREVVEHAEMFLSPDGSHLTPSGPVVEVICKSSKWHFCAAW